MHRADDRMEPESFIATQAKAETAGVLVKGLFHAASSTISYVVVDDATSHCVVIDSVLDFNPRSGRTGTEHVDCIVEYINESGLSLDWILETHAHADHLSGAQVLKERYDAPIVIGEQIRTVQRKMKRLFNLGDDFAVDGSQFDRLVAEGDRIRFGRQCLRVMHTPGHTPACVTYLTEGHAFIGDTLFMPDYGTARADFPSGSAKTLYRSIQRIFDLPANTRLYMCHDYRPGGRAPKWESTIIDEMERNIHIRKGMPEADFVRMREARDHILELPVNILPALQVNIRAGKLPPPEANGVSYLKIPLNVFR